MNAASLGAMESMRVDVRLFAILRERAGRDTVAVELEPGATVADAIGALAEHAALRGVLDRLPVTMAVNRDYAGPDTELHPGDELALIPPVSGGADAGDVHARVSAEPLSLDAVSALVVRPGAGAIVSFQGVTREVEQPRLRGLRRDGRGADRRDPRRVPRSPRPRGDRRRAPDRDRARSASRA